MRVMNTNDAGLVTPYLKHEFGISTCVNCDPLICTFIRELTSRYCGTIVDVNRVRRNKLSYNCVLLNSSRPTQLCSSKKEKWNNKCETYPTSWSELRTWMREMLRCLSTPPVFSNILPLSTPSLIFIRIKMYSRSELVTHNIAQGNHRNHLTRFNRGCLLTLWVCFARLSFGSR